MTGRVYLDWNATAPLRPEARAAMLAAMDLVGNPSSVHAEGRAARALVERARAQVAGLAGCAPEQVVFTSGATEGIATVARAGWALAVATGMEHDAVHLGLAPAATPGIEAALTCHGDPDNDALPGPAFLRDGAWEALAARPGPAPAVLLAATAAEGETGLTGFAAALLDRLAAQVRQVRPDARLRRFSDATQRLGKAGFSFADSGLDAAVASAHKLGGPKGVGALILREPAMPGPLLVGGGQESRRRAGTENLIGIAGFGAAAEAARRDLEAGVWERVEYLRIILENALASAAPDLIVVGQAAERLPNTSCFAVPGWRGETQVMLMDLAGFAVSAGAACTSGKVRASRVLRAMGHDETTAGSAIRVSLGPTTTEAEVLAFARAWAQAHSKRRDRAA